MSVILYHKKNTNDYNSLVVVVLLVFDFDEGYFYYQQLPATNDVKPYIVITTYLVDKDQKNE